ncbi:MAG: T9SS type A sorting domain-containing protein [Bacteroidota bacterium]|nr:T9SS type A sorting domain-containing protein [Bacteroidota bacterium]
MNKMLLFCLFITITLNSFGQVLIVKTPASIAGVYNVHAAAFGAVIDQEWSGDLVIVNDGTANPTQGCFPLINGAAVVGKIALIDRGSCEFGVKCLNAQDAGATIAIVINNQPTGTIAMGAGAVGAGVTIPCAMITMADGQKLKEALIAGETVTVSFGLIKFDNDIKSLARTDYFGPPIGTFPLKYLNAPDQLVVTPGANITNIGNNVANNVKLNATITHYPPGSGTGEKIYDETGFHRSIDPDSSGIITTNPFDVFVAGKKMGRYALDYKTSTDSNELSAADNVYSTDFSISDNILNKGRWNPVTRAPIYTNAYRAASQIPIEFLSMYDLQSATGDRIDSVIFYVSSSPNLASVAVEAFVYTWEDTNGDSLINNSELLIRAVGYQDFPDTETATQAVMRIAVEDFQTATAGYVLAPTDRYVIIGVRYSATSTPATNVFFGFDEEVDQTQAINAAGGLASFDVFDMPYGFVLTWDPSGVPDIEASLSFFTGLFGAISTAISLTLSTDTKDILSENEMELKVLGNPVSNELRVSVKLEKASKLSYQIIDLNGRIVFQGADPAGTEFYPRFKVDFLANGHYFLKVKTEKGFQKATFTVAK